MSLNVKSIVALGLPTYDFLLVSNNNSMCLLLCCDRKLSSDELYLSRNPPFWPLEGVVRFSKENKLPKG